MPAMATNLYETLGIPRDATPEEIRKAYKKRALQTHPDRLPPGAGPEEKAESEELFRKVNNAYEVLNDPQNRRVYDLHGVWPPPEPYEERPRRHSHTHRREPYSRHYGSSYNDPFSHPLFSSANRFGFPPAQPQFHRTRPHDFEFTNPFTLFESIFGEMNRQFEQFHNDPFLAQPITGRARGGPFDSRHEFAPFPFGGGMSMGMQNGMHPRSQIFQTESRSFRDSSGRGGRGLNWTSEQRVTKTVNGVTESVWTRRDLNGNEHITYTYPDGRERYTVNGIEQPAGGGNDRYIPPPPPYPEPPQSQHPPIVAPRPDYVAPPLPQVYDTQFSADAVYPDSDREHDYHHRGDSKKKWWRGR